jgi:hypothetical protein
MQGCLKVEVFEDLTFLFHCCCIDALTSLYETLFTSLAGGAWTPEVSAGRRFDCGPAALARFNDFELSGSVLAVAVKWLYIAVLRGK